MMKSSSPNFFTKTKWSHIVLLKSWFSIKESNLLYHYLSAYFSPYKFFFNLHTSSYLSLTLNPSGCSMYIYSFKSLCKKVVFMSSFTSSYLNSKFKLTVNLRTTRIEDIFTTKENIFFKINTFLLTEALYN